MSTDDSVAEEMDVIESEVIEFLSELSASELEKACDHIELSVPEPKKGKKNQLQKLLLGHLITEGSKEEAVAEVLYKKLHTYLTGPPASEIEEEE